MSATFPRTVRSSPGASPDSLRIKFAGFSILVSSGSPIEAVAPDGTSKPLALKAVEKIQGGVQARFEGGAELRATVAAAPTERLTLAASVQGGAAFLRMRYALDARARVVESSGKVLLESGGAIYDIGLPSSSLAPDRGSLALDLQGEARGRLTMTRRQAPIPAAAPRPAAEPATASAVPKDPAAIKAEIAAWRDKAWNGWSVSRFDPDRLAWKDADGTPRFSERALVAYLAESFARGSPGEALDRAKGARGRWGDRLTYLSAPYLGGLAPRMDALAAADQAEAGRIGGLVQDRSPAIFERENLLHFLFDRAPYPLAQEFLRYAAGVDPGKLNARQIVGLIGCAVEARGLLKDEENPFKVLGSAADRLAPALRKTAGGYFLVTDDDGSTELKLSLLAGAYLMRFGAAEGKDGLLAFGQGLVEGAIGLADANGAMPARVVAKAGNLEQKSGALLAEDAYPILADNTYYPREISLYRESGPGAWIWTCSPAVAIETRPDRSLFTCVFPVGRAHYMAFAGVKAFTNIQLYDIDYSPDADFENYDASGYLYRKPNASLLVKMKHKKEREAVRLAF